MESVRAVPTDATSRPEPQFMAADSQGARIREHVRAVLRRLVEHPGRKRVDET